MEFCCHLLSSASFLFRLNHVVDEILVGHYLCLRSREAARARWLADMLAALWCRQRGCSGCGNASLARRASFVWRPAQPRCSPRRTTSSARRRRTDMDTPRAKRCRGALAVDVVGRAGAAAGRSARTPRRRQQAPAASKLKSRLRLRIPAVPLLGGRPRRRRRRPDGHRDGDDDLDGLQDPLQDLHPTWTWGSGRLRRRQRHRQLLRPHSTGSTGSTASSSSSIASASSFASTSSTTSSCSSSASSTCWSSTSPEPPQLSSADLSFAMARPPVTRRTARIARELYSAWSGRVGASAYIPSEKVQQLFNDLQLYPSKLEVVEMLRCAQQRAQRTEPAFLTYEEFSVFAKELKRAAKGISWPSQLSQLPQLSQLSQQPSDRDAEDPKRSRPRRRAPTRSPQVFLGGSCNPTTWRQDDAIPLLKDLDITFYNPQVSDWAPELIEKEHFAKKNAEVLLFVIDNQTRNTASTVEVAFYSGLKRQKMVLVVHPYQSSGVKIAGEEILDDEWRDLITCQKVMQLLVERQGMPIFPSIRLAVDGIDKVLREKVPVQELQPGKKSLSQINEPEKEAKENVPVNIDQFSATVMDSKSTHESRNISRPLKSCSSNHQPSFDVYLCGDEVAVPFLKKHGLKYVIPCNQSVEWTKQTLQSNVTIADRSRVLLFIITDSSRSLAELCLAAYYIGLNSSDYKVVLHVSLLTEDSVINGKKLSNIAIKEYNRGRMYLRDLAVREGVDLLDSVSGAVDAAAKCVKSSAAR